MSLKEISITKPQISKVKLGYKVPNVKLTDKNLTQVSLNEFKSQYKIISTFPSIDTGVCDIQTKEIYKLAKEKNIELLNVSADLPFAFNKWCALNAIEDIKIFSDYNGLNLGKELGIIIKKFNLLYRTVFILNKKNEIIYMQFADKVSSQINFDEISNFVSSIL